MSYTSNDERVDEEFAIGAIRYLRNAGLRVEEIRASLVGELGLDAKEAEAFLKQPA